VLARAVLVAALALIVVLLLLTPAASAEGQRNQPRGTAELDAVRLEVDRDELRAEGRVRLRLGTCRVSANEMRLSRSGGFEGRQVCLQPLAGAAAGPALRLEAQRLRVDRAGRLEAEHLEGVTLCACPGDPPGSSWLTFSARRARVAAAGRRIHLHRPVLRLWGLPVAALPYLPLPLRPGTSGLLLPSVSYSGRDGARLEQGVYLGLGDRADLALWGGWIQGRGALARTRLRLASEPGSTPAAAELTLTGLRDGDRWRGAARGHALVVGERWAVGLAPDLVSDEGLLADLERAPARVFAPYLRSRLFAWGGLSSLWGAARGDLFQELARPLRGREQGLHGLVHLGLGSTALRIAGPLFFELEAGLAHLGPVAALETASGGAAGTLLSISPALDLALRLGPLRISGKGSYRTLVSWGALASSDRGVHHLVGSRVEASVPLDRGFRRTSGDLHHRLEPLAALVWATSLGPDVQLEQLGLAARPGPWGVAGLRTILWHRPAAGTDAGVVVHPASRRVEATVQLEAPLADDADDWRLAAKIMLVPAPRRLWAEASAGWAPQARELVELQSRICGRIGLGEGGSLTACGGYQRLGGRRIGARLFGSEPEGTWLVVDSLVAVGRLVRADQLVGSLRLLAGRLSGGAELAGDPVRGELSHGGGWLDLLVGCGCLRLGAGASWHAGQRWPDLMLRLGLSGAGLAGCGLVNL